MPLLTDQPLDISPPAIPDEPCPAIPTVDPAWRQQLALLYPEVDQLVSSLASGPGFAGPPCADSGVVALDYRQVDTVRNSLCRICLGPLEGMQGQLAATLEPSAYAVPSMGAAALWRTLVPHASEAFLEAFAGGVFPGNLNIDFPTSGTEDGPGLFFGAGSFEWVVRWAYTLTYGLAGFAARPYGFVADPCNVEQGTIEGIIRDATHATSPAVTVWLGADDVSPTVWGARCTEGTTLLTVSANGRASLEVAFGDGGGLIKNNAADYVNWNATLHCYGPRTNAARADYYLWWADRLLQSAQATGNTWHAFMAVLCARLGLANVLLVGSQVLHEIVHLTTAQLGHCSVPGVGTPLDNCTDKAMLTFLHSVLAYFGLPSPKREDAFASRVWSEETAGGYEVQVSALHCGLLATDHQVQLVYRWPNPMDAAVCRDPAMPTQRTFGSVPVGLGPRCPQPDEGLDLDPPPPPLVPQVPQAAPEEPRGPCCAPEDHGSITSARGPDEPSAGPEVAAPALFLDRTTPGPPWPVLRQFSLLEAVELDGYDPQVLLRAPLDLHGRLDPARLTADKALDLFLPMGDWQATGGIVEARGGVEVRGHTGLLLIAPAVQLANDPRGALTTVKIALPGVGYAGGNGVFGPASAWTVLGTADKSFVRTGWIVRLRSGTARAWCVASGWIDFRRG